MSTQAQSVTPAAVIHPALDLQDRIFASLEALRDLTNKHVETHNMSHAAEDAEANAAHKVTALVAQLVALALGVAEVAS